MKLLFHPLTGTLKPYPRSDDLPVVGLDAEYQIFALVEIEKPEVSEGSYLTRTEVIDTTAKTVTRGWDIVTPEPLPVSVSMRSFRLAIGHVLFAQITNALSAITDPADQFAAQIFLDHSTQVHRDHPLVTQFAALLGKTASEIDAIFAKAQAFDNATLATP